MLWEASSSIRYVAAYPRIAAARSVGPGRARLVIKLYDLVEGAGGTVWDCEPKFAHVHCGVELPGGERHPLWPELQAIIEEAGRTCEVCEQPGHPADDLIWRRILCDEHHQVFREGAFWRDVYEPWWPRLLLDHAEVWSGER